MTSPTVMVRGTQTQSVEVALELYQIRAAAINYLQAICGVSTDAIPAIPSVFRNDPIHWVTADGVDENGVAEGTLMVWRPATDKEIEVFNLLVKAFRGLEELRDEREKSKITTLKGV